MRCFSVQLILLRKFLHMNQNSKEGQIRSDIKIGMDVGIVMKEDQKSGLLTDGIVSRILTNSKTHPHGIKVKLQTGEVGRIKEFN